MANGERVFMHRCGWAECPPFITCSAEVEDVGRIDGSTVLVRFCSPAAVGAEPYVRTEKGQNFYRV
jgi:hypothetical protein